MCAPAPSLCKHVQAGMLQPLVHGAVAAAASSASGPAGLVLTAVLPRADGEMGYLRVGRGANDACLEMQCNWATPKTWTEANFPCDESGANCVGTGRWTDPSSTGVPLGAALAQGR